MPLEKAAVGTPGFGKNISEMEKSGHPAKQAIAAAYSKARGDNTEALTGMKNAHLDSLFAAADALFERADAMEMRCADAEETMEQYIRRTGSNSGYGQKYNPASVQNAINNNRTGKIGGKEAKLIHSLLRGRG